MKRNHQHNKQNIKPSLPLKDPTIKKQISLSTYFCPCCKSKFLSTFNPNSLSCPYCNKELEIAEEDNQFILPDYIVPFNNSKEDVFNKFKNYIKKRFLFPVNFIQGYDIDNLVGMYIPVFLSSINSTAKSKVLGQNTITTRQDLNQVDITQFYEIDVESYSNFYNLKTDIIEQNRCLIDKIKPYNITRMIPFSQDYLNNFIIEYTKTDSVSVFHRILKKINDITSVNVLNDISNNYTNVYLK